MAKNKWVIMGHPLHIDIPLSILFLATSLMRDEKPFAQGEIDKVIKGRLEANPLRELCFHRPLHSLTQNKIQ